MSWWYQFVGRATRIHPNKKDAIVFDLAGNLKKFGRVEDLVYAYGNGKWCLLGRENILLTETPMPSIGTIIGDMNELYLGNEGVALENSNDIENKKIDSLISQIERSSNLDKVEKAGQFKVTFGKHNGKMLQEIPAQYLDWMLKNFNWTSSNKSLKESIECFLSVH